MKKWLVECHIDNREQFYSREPPSGIFYDTVVVYGDDGNVKEYYFEFRAREVE